MIAPEVASKLLDEVIYERVVELVDLEGLFMFEQQLWLALHELGDDQIGEVAKQLVDRALAKLPDDPRRYASIKPFGMDCELCEQEARDHTAAKRRGKRA